MTPGLSPGVQEFAQDSKQFLPPWVLYFSCTTELERFLSALNAAWRNIYQVSGQGSGAAVPRRERAPAWEAGGVSRPEPLRVPVTTGCGIQSRGPLA